MFPRVVNQHSNLKRRLFCSNQRIFAGRLPIKFFYFEDVRWSIFGKIMRQKATDASTKSSLKGNSPSYISLKLRTHTSLLFCCKSFLYVKR